MTRQGKVNAKGKPITRGPNPPEAEPADPIEDKPASDEYKYYDAWSDDAWQLFRQAALWVVLQGLSAPTDRTEQPRHARSDSADNNSDNPDGEHPLTARAQNQQKRTCSPVYLMQPSTFGSN